MATHHGFELKKADESGAFLQGREQQADRYVVPVNELADALGITGGKPARMRKDGQVWLGDSTERMGRIGV